MAENFAEYEWQYRYCTSALNLDGKPTDILHDFYIPALKRATKYDRVAGYFRSTSLAAASQGYTAFLRHGGAMRLIVGADLDLKDMAAILKGSQQRLSDCLVAELDSPEKWPDEVKNGVSLLGEMVASGQLEVRVAFRVDAKTGEPLIIDSPRGGYVHEKWLVMTDEDGRRLYGSGSLNESRTALTVNAENIDIHCDWKSGDNRNRVDGAQQDFENLWNNTNPHMVVFTIPEAVKRRLIELRTLSGHLAEIDGTILSGYMRMTPKEKLRFAVLYDAPRMPGGEFIGMYSAPVSPWPHQENVSRRLVESWPYSYMLCDEVGLGKTIEAALAIRSLVLSGRVKRVLIVAPASLTEQWHRELAGKALLPFALSRVAPGKKREFTHRYIYPDKSLSVDGNLYGPDLNIVSSGLVRRQNRLTHLRQAEDFDIVLVDEAHYARRKNPRKGSFGYPDYGDLYQVMRTELRKKAKSLWLATATPMQIDSIEAYDLFVLTNRVGPFQADPALTKAYFLALGELANRRQLDREEWFMMGRSFLQIKELDPYLWGILNKTAITNKNRKPLYELSDRNPKNADLRDITQPLFAASPLSRVMMRHSRALLELYKQHNELSGNLARRHVRPILAIKFTPAEREFYVMLEEYCKGLKDQISNHEARQMMMFLLNFLRLRFASSFYAIQKSLDRRLRRVKNTLMVGKIPASHEELEARLEELKNDEYSEGDLDSITIDALLKDRSPQDLEWEKTRLSEMLETLSNIRACGMPSKMLALLEELEKQKKPDGRLHQTVLFTRFYDTLTSIQNCLQMQAPTMRVGVYAGKNRASWFDPTCHSVHKASHEEVKSRFLNGEIDLLLCTDAAAEGLNLQTANLLINFDLGWNPMKIEQRIGRIDRIGQKHDDIYVVNMCYVGSEEEVVYGRLVQRLAEANLIVGTQQIALLPVTNEDFQKLRDGEITEEELRRISEERIRKQREMNARMEMSAEDIYQMYRRMSENTKTQRYPATVDDLWTCLTESEYLKGLGAHFDTDGHWTLPASEKWNTVLGAIRHEDISDVTPYISWGDTGVDSLLATLGKDLEETPYIRRITLSDIPDIRENITALAVSTDEGVKLITSYWQIDGLNIDISRPISSEDIQNCQAQLSAMIESEREKNRSIGRAEYLNGRFAVLHGRFITRLAVNILQGLASAGYSKIMDAIKQMENPEEMHSIEIPAGEFKEMTNRLLFQVYETAGKLYVTVIGVLLHCVIDLVKRETGALRGVFTEKKTVDVIRRLERR